MRAWTIAALAVPVLGFIVYAQVKHHNQVEAALDSAISSSGDCLYPLFPEHMVQPNCLTLRQYDAINAAEMSTWSRSKRQEMEAEAIRLLREGGASKSTITDYKARYERNVMDAP